jgi:hypothetical protein
MSQQEESKNHGLYGDFADGSETVAKGDLELQIVIEVIST